MKNKNILIYASLVVFILALLITLISSQTTEEEDIMFLGFELEKLLALIISILCIILFVITFLAYKRDGRNRLLFISLAFLLFSIKSLLISSELFFPEVEFFNPLSAFLEFAAIICFFYGTIKK